jgi:hypothetical protein
VYIILPIAFAVLIISWLLLRRFTKVWVDRPITAFESFIAGISAWLFIFSIFSWFGGIALTLIELLGGQEIEDVWALLFAVLLTGYGMDFLIRSNPEMHLGETKEFIKEAIQFRRSAQRRLDLISLIQLKQKDKKLPVFENSPDSRQRVRLQAKLFKEKELDTQITRLREGNIVDIEDVWRERTKTIPTNSFFQQVQEVRVDPNRKRLSLTADFPELNAISLQDEMIILRFNRQVYDFMQFLNSENWIKPYTQFFESYFIICRATRTNPDGIEILYPFMKVGMSITDLRKMESGYFNPRKLSEIAALAFNNGSPV